MKSNGFIRVVTNPWVYPALFCLLLALIFAEFTPYAPGSQWLKLGLVATFMALSAVMFLIAVWRSRP